MLYKPEEGDISAKSRMTVSDSVDQLESGAGDVRKVVRHQDEAMNGEMTQPVRPRSTHELSAPTVDLVTGKCKPGKMIRTVSASPLTVDRIISCKPEPDCVQHGVNADVLPPTDNVGMSATDINVSAPVVTAPVLGEVMGNLHRRSLRRAICRSPRSCCHRLGGRPRRPRRPPLCCHGALQKTRRRRFRPIV